MSTVRGSTAAQIAARRQRADLVEFDHQMDTQQAIRAGTNLSVSQRVGTHARGLAIGWVLARMWHSVSGR